MRECRKKFFEDDREFVEQIINEKNEIGIIEEKTAKSIWFHEAVYHQWAEYAGEIFCNLLGKKCVSFQRILVLTVEVDNYNRKGKMNIDNDKRLIFI